MTQSPNVAAPSPDIEGRIARAAAYLEPEVYVIVQELAVAENKTFSAWLRQLIIKELVDRDKLPKDLMVKLLMG
jgi:hypothetical protein